MIDTLITIIAIALGSFFLVHVTPESWVEPKMTISKRLWGILLTPGLLIVVPLQHLVSGGGRPAANFWEDMKEYLAAVWLGREYE